jgi:hypothetical protein
MFISVEWTSSGLSGGWATWLATGAVPAKINDSSTKNAVM